MRRGHFAARATTAAAVVDGKLYAVGGYDGSGLSRAFACTEASFTVRTVDFCGKPRTEGGDVVEAELLVVAAGGDVGAAAEAPVEPVLAEAPAEGDGTRRAEAGAEQPESRKPLPRLPPRLRASKQT